MLISQVGGICPRIEISKQNFSKNSIYVPTFAYEAFAHIVCMPEAACHTQVVLKFLHWFIFTMYDTHREIISNEGTHFCFQIFNALLAKYRVKHKVALLTTRKLMAKLKFQIGRLNKSWRRQLTTTRRIGWWDGSPVNCTWCVISTAEYYKNKSYKFFIWHHNTYMQKERDTLASILKTQFQ